MAFASWWKSLRLHCPRNRQTHRIRRYYLTALVVLALVSVINYALLSSRIYTQINTMDALKISASMSTLAQRIAFRADELIDSNALIHRDVSRAELVRLGQIMNTRWAALVRQAVDPATTSYQMLFMGRQPLDLRIRAYLDAVHELTTLAAPTQSSVPLVYILSERLPLSNALDALTLQFELAEDQQTQHTTHAALLLLILNLAGLIGIGRFIFVPMERQTRQHEAGLQAEITEHKATATALADQQRFNERVLAAMPHILYVYDIEQGRNIFINREITAQLGYTLEQIQASGSHVLEHLMHPDDLPKLPPHFAALDAAADHQVLEIEYRMRHVNGEWRWLLSREVVFARCEHGLCHQILGVAQDITERKQAETRHIELSMERERVRVLEKFVRTASHDLRTPLSVISTSTYLLGKVTDPARQAERLTLINDQIAVMSRMVEGLNRMVNLETTDNIERREVDVNQLVTMLSRRYQATAQRQQIALRLELGARLPLLYADEARLGEVVTHLLDNALQHTHTGGQVTIRTCQEDDQMVIEVEDTGDGIPAEHLPLIFDRFYKVNDARTANGSGAGLGLTIVRKIIDLHGGTIDVESTPGSGSLFRVLLPVPDAAAVPA